MANRRGWVVPQARQVMPYQVFLLRVEGERRAADLLGQSAGDVLGGPLVVHGRLNRPVDQRPAAGRLRLIVVAPFISQLGDPMGGLVGQGQGLGTEAVGEPPHTGVGLPERGFRSAGADRITAVDLGDLFGGERHGCVPILVMSVQGGSFREMVFPRSNFTSSARHYRDWGL